MLARGCLAVLLIANGAALADTRIARFQVSAVVIASCAMDAARMAPDAHGPRCAAAPGLSRIAAPEPVVRLQRGPGLSQLVVEF